MGQEPKAKSLKPVQYLYAPVRIRMRRLRRAIRADPEIFRPAGRRMPALRQKDRAQAAVVAGDSIQRNGLVHHRLRAEGRQRRRRRKAGLSRRERNKRWGKRWGESRGEACRESRKTIDSRQSTVETTVGNR